MKLAKIILIYSHSHSRWPEIYIITRSRATHLLRAARSRRPHHSRPVERRPYGWFIRDCEVALGTRRPTFPDAPESFHLTEAEQEQWDQIDYADACRSARAFRD